MDSKVCATAVGRRPRLAALVGCAEQGYEGAEALLILVYYLLYGKFLDDLRRMQDEMAAIERLQKWKPSPAADALFSDKVCLFTFFTHFANRSHSLSSSSMTRSASSTLHALAVCRASNAARHVKK